MCGRTVVAPTYLDEENTKKRIFCGQKAAMVRIAL